MTKRIPLEPADLAFKAQGIARRALSARISEFLREHWGDAWLDKLNSLIEEDNKTQIAKDPAWKPRELVLLGPAGPRWDNNAMLRALRDAVRAMPELGKKTRDIDRIADDLRRSRNKLSHEGEFGPADREFAVSYINKAINLMQMIGGQGGVSELQQLKSLIHSSEGLSIAPDQQQKTIDPAPPAAEFHAMMSMMEEMLRRMPAEGPKEQGARSQDQPAPLASKSPPQATSKVLGRRRGPLPDPEVGLVVFPNVSELTDAESDFGYISTKVFPHRGTQAITEISGFDNPQRRNLYYKIVSDARNTESDDARATLSTRARINPTDFDGASFGLGAALADRSARYGLAAVLAGGHLIATGVIVPDGHGSVGEVDGFEAKVRLLDREARKGSYFVFPAANLEKTDQATKERLIRADREGRYKWKAIRHLDEVIDLFPSNELPGFAANVEVSAGTASRVGLSEAAVKLAKERSGFSKAMAFLLSLALGSVLLGAFYAFGEWRSQTLVDPKLVQASDERLNQLAQAAALLKAPPDSAPLCRQLLKATSGLTDMDRQRVLPVHVAAIGLSGTCGSSLNDSAKRWDDLQVVANAAAKRSSISLEAATSARSALTGFDLTEAQEPQKANALALVDAVIVRLRASKSRWNALAKAIASWQANETSRAIDDAARTYGALTFEDFANATEAERQLAEIGKTSSEMVESSDERLRATVQIADHGIETAQLTLFNRAEQVVAALTPLDFARANSAQLAAITRVQNTLKNARYATLIEAAKTFEKSASRRTADTLIKAATVLHDGDKENPTSEQNAALVTLSSAQLAIIASNDRISALQEALGRVNDAESKGQGVASSYAALIAAADAIEAFDEPDTNAIVRAAVVKSTQIRLLLRDSDKRIADAQKWAERAVAFGAFTPTAIAKALHSARRALTDLDMTRLTSEQRSLLESVCGVTDTVKPGAIAPKDPCSSYVIRTSPPSLPPSIRLQ